VISMRFLIFLLASWVVELLGLVVVPLALPFRRVIEGTRQKFAEYVGWWELVRLPAWALWWDNPYDGMLGDKRGWWNKRTGDCRTLWSMFKWAAIRNPANHFSRHVIGCDVSDCKIAKLHGHDVVSEEPGLRQWQLLCALDNRGRRYFRFYLCFAYKRWPDHGLMIDLGWKIKLSHNGTASDARPQDRYKGLVCVISPWKGL